MALINLDGIKGMKVITQDAFDVGEVMDIRYNPSTWEVLGLKVKSTKSVSGMLNTGSGKSMILVKPDDYAVNDVILFKDELENAKSRISADSDNLASVSFIDDKKVMTADNVYLGTVENILIDMSGWKIQSVSIKLDKNACPLLGVKKGLFAKIGSGMRVENISSVTDNIFLAINVDHVKDELAFN